MTHRYIDTTMQLRCENFSNLNILYPHSPFTRYSKGHHLWFNNIIIHNRYCYFIEKHAPPLSLEFRSIIDKQSLFKVLRFSETVNDHYCVEIKRWRLIQNRWEWRNMDMNFSMTVLLSARIQFSATECLCSDPRPWYAYILYLIMRQSVASSPHAVRWEKMSEEDSLFWKIWNCEYHNYILE